MSETGKIAGAVLNDERALYEEWKRTGSHLAEYVSELVGTFFLLFCVVGAVVLCFAPGSSVPSLLPSSVLRLLLVGLLLGAASGLVAISPPGRLSGAHLNPAMSLGFWLLGKMHGRDVAGYLTGQLAGAIGGTFLGCAAFGRLSLEVHAASLHPGPRISGPRVFAGEVAATFVLSLAVFSFVSHKKLARWTPLMATGLVGLLVCVDGNYSGAGMNPARWLGPAAAGDVWAFGWAYALAPLGGTLLAAGLRRSLPVSGPVPHTGKLFHDPRYRSLFLGDRLPSKPPNTVRPSPGGRKSCP